MARWRPGGDGGLGGDLVERTEIEASASQMSFPISRKCQYSIYPENANIQYLENANIEYLKYLIPNR